MNKPKIKGTMAESAVVSYLRTVGFPHCERLALQGGKDRGDITGIPGVVIEVKNCQQYSFNAWLKEATVEGLNAQAEHEFVVAKPRFVGATRVGQWYALMYQRDFAVLVSQAAREGGQDVTIWKQEMSGSSISTMISKYMKLAEANRVDSGSTHSCVRITPNGVKDPNMFYVVTTLADMADLLVRAGYGRRDDQAGA